MSKRKGNKGNMGAVVGMALAAAVKVDEQENLDALLSNLDSPDEIVEKAESPVIEAITPAGEHEIEAAVAAAEKTEAMQQHYAGQEGESVSTTTPEPTTATTEAPATSEGVKEKKKRVHYASQSERIAALMGDKLGEFTVLTVGDAERDPAALKAELDETIGKMAKKVGEKAAMLLTTLKDGGQMNEVMARAFRVLKRDGQLTSGDKGNLQQDLLLKPYSIGTARSQANQMFMLFPMLKIAVKGEKGTIVANPDSTLLAAANALLKL